MIEADAVSKSYGSLRAVEGVSFSVPEGQVLGLLGPNGAGKTTVLRMLAGVLTPSAGTVRILGKDIVDHRIDAQKQIGYLPEHSPLYPSFTTLEHLRFSARVRGLHGDNAEGAVQRTARACGVEHVGDRLIGQLSRGYRQRIGLAAALVHDPRVLILDEPTSGLDPNQIEEFRSVVRQAAKTTAIVFSTHILQEVEAVCNDILVIDRGTRVAYGSRAEIMASLAGGTAVRATVLEIPPEAALSALEELGTVSVESGATGEQIVRVRLAADHTPEEVHAWSVEFGIALRSLERETESLQMLFGKLTLSDREAGRQS